MSGGAGFVGRRDELADLAALIARARRGRGGMALVVGEPGIGKTSLVERALQDVGLPALWGRTRDGAPPLWLWDQVVRAGRAQGLFDLVPVSATLHDPVLAGTGHDRFRRFDEISAGLFEAAGRQPLVIVLDDVHWADPDSLSLLEFVAPGLAGAALALIVTARTAELDPLPRADVTVELGGLAGGDLAELIATHIGAAPAHDVVVEAARHTGGNPFFVGEVARLLRASGHAGEATRWAGVLPQGVRAVLARRFARLPQVAHEALATAAVLGFEVDATVLAAVLDVGRDDLYERLQPCVRAGLLYDAGDGRFQFAHALVREELIAELDIGRRRHLHERAAEVLEATVGVREAAAIAIHRSAAGDRAAAARWAECAADGAFRSAMYAEACDWYAKALEHDPDSPTAIKYAAALARCGRIAEANDAYLAAANRARTTGDSEQLAMAALGIGTSGGGFEVRLLDAGQLALLREALDGLGNDDSPLRSVLLARLSVASTLGATQAERVALADEALAIARRLGDDGALAYALSAWCDAHAGAGDTERRLAAAAEMLPAAQRAGDPELELLARRFMIVAHMELGDVAQASRAIDAFAQLADRLRQPQFLWYARLVSGMRALLRGDLDEAFRLATEASTFGRTVASANAEMLADGSLLPMIRRERGEPDFLAALGEVVRDNPEAARGLDIVPLFGVGYGVDPEAVRRSLASIQERLTMDEDDGLYMLAMAQVGDGGALVGDEAAMARAWSALAPYPDRFVLDGTAAVCYGPAASTLARIAAARGDVDEARQLFARAASLLQGAGAPLLLARVEAEREALDGAAPKGRAAPGPVFRREGDVWLVAYDGESTRLRHSKGMSDLAELLARPGKQLHVFDLVAAAEGRAADGAGAGGGGGDLGEVIDARARSAYEQRIRHLTEEIEEAEENHDDERAARLDEERAALLAQLAGALGLSGRARRQGGDAERARKAVGMRVRESIARIEREMPALGRHLQRSIQTGLFCTYSPERPVDWQCQPSPGAHRS